MTPPEPAGGSAPRPGASRPPAEPHADSRQLWAAADSGWIMVVELVTAVFTWGGIGWLLDRWLGTAPWLMVTGFALGWGTGIYLVWLRFSAAERAGAAPSQPASGGDPAARTTTDETTKGTGGAQR